MIRDSLNIKNNNIVLLDWHVYCILFNQKMNFPTKDFTVYVDNKDRIN